MKSYFYIPLMFFLFSACSPGRTKDKSEALIFCAASLTDVISDIASSYESETNSVVKLNLASSGTLARQIESGAQPDVFISANEKWLDYLVQLGKVDKETEKRIAGNQMVLIVPSNSKLQPFKFSKDIDLPKLFEGRISIGDPKHVPAGAYGVQVLENLGCKEVLQPRFLPAKDVRSALMVVELGEVDAGIVYKTDALKSTKVKILTEFPDSLHQPVGYYMAIIKGEKNDRALQLYNYIVSEKMIPVWKKYGFEQ